MNFDGSALAVAGVRTLEPYRPGKPVEALEREYGVVDAVKLASNENPLGAGAAAIAALRGLEQVLGRYPDGSGYVLKQALARHLDVAAGQLTLGNGSNDVLDLLARAYAGPGEEVVYSAHAFAVYAIVTRAVGATPVVVPAVAWGHDLDAMQRAVTARTRIVFVANPNNPTGTRLGASDLAAFVAALPEHVIVVVDEAYFEYVDAPDHPDCIQWIERHPNLVVTRTFSKIHGLAALRIGYGVAHESVADVLNRVRQPFNVGTAGLLAATAALADADHVQRSRAVNAAGLAQLQTGLQALGLDVIPSCANFIAFDTARDAAPIYEALLRRGVIVRPIANYGMPRHLRVTVGLPAENERFLAALGAVLVR